MVGTPTEILIAVLSCTIGITALAGGLQGYFFGVIGKIERACLFALAVCLITPSFITDVTGYIGFAAMVLYRNFVNKRNAKLVG